MLVLPPTATNRCAREAEEYLCRCIRCRRGDSRLFSGLLPRSLVLLVPLCVGTLSHESCTHCQHLLPALLSNCRPQCVARAHLASLSQPALRTQGRVEGVQRHQHPSHSAPPVPPVHNAVIEQVMKPALLNACSASQAADQASCAKPSEACMHSIEAIASEVQHLEDQCPGTAKAFVGQLMAAVVAAPVAGAPEVVQLRRFAVTLQQIAASGAQIPPLPN